MKTLNSLILVAVASLVLAACQTRSVHEVPPPVVSPAEGSSPTETPAVEMPVTKMPSPQEQIRLGIILGPGGARTLAEIGFLKELQTRKIPVHAIVGLEWGSLVAASFAAKGSAHESEWQISKMKDPGSNWLGNSAANVKTFIDPISSYLSSFSAESLKIPFSCPSFNLRKTQMFMMARGRLDQLLPFCLPYPPHFAPFEKTIAAPREIPMAVDFLRKQGANYIVLVNVLTGLAENEAVGWQETAYEMKRRWPGVHERLDLMIRTQNISDFKSRQELIQLGSEQSAKFADKLMNRF